MYLWVTIGPFDSGETPEEQLYREQIASETDAEPTLIVERLHQQAMCILLVRYIYS
jgi:hypothetical protein